LLQRMDRLFPAFMAAPLHQENGSAMSYSV
jgi:hypothetical protein